VKIRRPVVAGYFYPRDRARLVESIEWSFKHKLGPGTLPQVAQERRKNVIGYVVPHAGYMYSGPIATHVFHDMAGYGVPETIIIIGTNHTGLGALSQYTLVVYGRRLLELSKWIVNLEN